MPPKRLLVIRFSAMGDVAMTVPVVRSLTQQYPDTEVTLLSRPFFEPIFAGIENVRFKSVDLKGQYAGFGGIYRLFCTLRAEEFDAVADLHGVLRTHVLTSFFQLFGVKVAKIDKGRSEKKALTRPKDKVFKQLTTTHERYADVFRKLGFNFQLQPFVQKVAKSRRKKIGIAPFAQHTAKQYPLLMMQEVALGLSKKYDIYLFGGGNTEKELLHTWATKSVSIKNTVGQQSFADELNIISELDLMVSMDSGNGHLAANFGVPVITIWGLTHPFAGFAPYGSSEKNWLLADRTQFPLIPTSVYGNSSPAGYEAAMNTITPTAIVEKVSEIIS